MINLKNNKIWIRASVLILLPLLVLLVFATSLFSYREYRSDMNDAAAGFERDNALIARSLQTNLWELDTVVVASQVDNLVAVGSYSWVKMSDDTGYLYEVGETPDRRDFIVGFNPLLGPREQAGRVFGEVQFARDLSHLAKDAWDNFFWSF